MLVEAWQLSLSTFRSSAMRFLFLQTFAFLFILSTFCHAKDTNLRRGRVFTEAEGKAHLSKMAANVPDAATWKARAIKIRENILRGAQLEQLPSPCPLNVNSSFKT